MTETFSSMSTLVYMTNQEIGPRSDVLKLELRRRGFYLDVRDKTWFVDRIYLDSNRTLAAQEFTNDILPSPFTADKAESQLSNVESRTLLLFLELQRDDEAADKSLTRQSYEALCRAALRDTSTTQQMTEDDVLAYVNAALPKHNAEGVRQLVRSALRRLSSRKVVQQNTQTKRYYLTIAEQERLHFRAAQVELLRLGFVADVEDAVTTDARIYASDAPEVCRYVLGVIGRCLLARGEQFASALTHDRALYDVTDLEKTMLMYKPPVLKTKDNPTAVCISLIERLLRTPSNDTMRYLKLLSDCYTLFAFLAEAADVQKAMNRVFDHGELWLDTSVVLPAIAEQCRTEDDPIARPFSALLRRIKETGLEVHITQGVLEEVVSHISLCLQYARSQEWFGRVPMMIAVYLLTGKPKSSFAAFIGTFMTQFYPERDLTAFLYEEYRIRVSEASGGKLVSDALRLEITTFWDAVVQARRPDTDALTIAKLARHDAENYINVLQRRKLAAPNSAFGYNSWLVTLDSAARSLVNRVSQAAHDEILHPPVISLDFLTRYLTFGPRRASASTNGGATFEIFSPNIAETVPPDLVRIAEEKRVEYLDVSERVRMRRIANEIDRQKISYGALQLVGDPTKVPRAISRQLS